MVECFLYPSENGCETLPSPADQAILRDAPGSDPQLPSVPIHDLPFEDSLIVVAGHYNIGQLYDFAAASNELGAHIRNSKDSLVHTVAQLANSKSGQLYFPFLDNLVKGKITVEDIDKVKDDDLNYYRLLVRTRLDYAAGSCPRSAIPLWK